MRNILTVMKFTIKDMLRRKSFIISTLLILVMIIVGFNIPNIIKAIQGEDVQEKILISDNDNIFNGNLEMLKQADLGYDIEIANSTYDEIKGKIENEEIDSAILIENVNNNINIRYIVENISFVDSVPEDIIDTMNTIYTNMKIAEAIGITEEEWANVAPRFQVNMEQTSEEEAHGNVAVIMLMSIVLFYAIYFCAYQVSSSITTEKTSKIVETLVTSTSPKTIVLRKNAWNRSCRLNSININSWNCSYFS